MNASYQSFLGNKDQCSSAGALIFRIFQLTVFFQICLRRSRQAYLPQTLPLSPWGVFTQMAGVLYFRKHSSRKTFVQAGSPQRTYFLSPFFCGNKEPCTRPWSYSLANPVCTWGHAEPRHGLGTSVLPVPGRQRAGAFGTARLRQEGDIMDV